MTILKFKKEAISIIILCFIIISLIFCSGMTNNTNKEKTEKIAKSQIHIIINARDDKTEVDISVNGKPYDNMLLNKGINFIPYKVKSKKPTVEILAYGDTLNPTLVKKKYNNYYTYINIAPPVDGDGYKFN